MYQVDMLSLSLSLIFFLCHIKIILLILFYIRLSFVLL